VNVGLKLFQERVVKETELFLRALGAERAAGNRHAAMDAWRCPELRALGLRPYTYRENALGEDVPNFCVKVPTGGGKTLLATQILGSIYRYAFPERRGAGLALWIVPTGQIYRDTLKRLRDRRDLYRVMLEHAVSRRIEVWERHEINRLSPVRLRDCLNILVIQLASTNRETKEDLRFFRDTGGNIVQHFPPENDFEAHRKMKEETPNLGMLVDDAEHGQHLVATSVGNLVRLCRPPVILDEGHKATSRRARQTIADINASIVVELSATPQADANILCRVSGQELHDEEMIKLPLNIATSGLSDWKTVLTRARDKQEALRAKAAEVFAADRLQRLIRPIILVQVERIGRDQQGAIIGGRLAVHAKDVVEYLTQRLNVHANSIRIKSAENDGLEDIELMDPECPVEWIITKAALQEGWDCPFAYILVSLNNTGSAKAMTQLVGRVLRQPYQERTTAPELNESYVFCLHQSAGEIAKQVKAALEKEGYEGDLEGLVMDASRKGARRIEKTIRIRQSFLDMYTRPFQGEIYLPRFCVKEGKHFVPFDYFEHLVSQVNVHSFPFHEIEWDLAETVEQAKDRYYSVTIGSGLQRERETDVDLWETDDAVLAWIVAGLRFDYLSFKQVRHVVLKVYERLIECHLSNMVKDKLALVKAEVRNRIERFVQEQVDHQTEAAFGRLFDADRIQFYLQCQECRFRIPSFIRLEPLGVLTPLTHDDGAHVEKSLFDFVEKEVHNEYERKIALCLDKQADVLWWYRNRVGPENFAVQGYKRAKMYPDFVVQQKANGRTRHDVLVLEGKGKHLEGNPDTTYKKKVAAYFSRAGRRVTWQQLGADFKDHVFRFQILDEAQPHGRNWQDELRDILAAAD
jgi:type III restriction enzyme